MMNLPFQFFYFISYNCCFLEGFIFNELLYLLLVLLNLFLRVQVATFTLRNFPAVLRIATMYTAKNRINMFRKGMITLCTTEFSCPFNARKIHFTFRTL